MRLSLYALLMILSMLGCPLVAKVGGGDISDSSRPTPVTDPIKEATPEVSMTAIPTDIDLSPFISRAQNATCADRQNALYLVDNQYVFWSVAGDCADASYAVYMFDARTQAEVCSSYDSIAGPQTACTDETTKALFDQLMFTNVQGVEGHTIVPIPFE